jgi:formiminotetrahydrofolate cyclodeaminase
MNEIAVERSLQGLLDAVAARTTAPGGGVVAGVVAALAGALGGMCARFTDGDQDSVVLRADELRARAAFLAQSDPAIYADYVRLRRSGRDDDIAAALDEAIRLPLEMAEVAAELAGLALGLARSGNPNLRGDAAVAVLMGAAAARAGAALVCENLAGGGGSDPRLARAAAIVASVGAVERDVLLLYPALAGP